VNRALLESGRARGDDPVARSALRICTAAGVVVAVTMTLGWIGAVTDAHGSVAALLLLPALGLAGCTVWFLRRDLIEAWPIAAMAAGVAAFGLLFLVMLDPAPFPTPDGPYVYKDPTLAVEVQRWSGDLPPDNLLPTAVAAFLVDDVDFRRHRPIMPGQEVTNRTVGAPLLISAVMRLGDDPFPKDSVGRFDYVGSSWPDVRTHLTSARERLGLSIGIMLNALIVLPIGGLAHVAIRNRKLALLTTGVLVASPLLVVQTFFTWPKAATAFGVLTALLAVVAADRPSGDLRGDMAIGFFCALAGWMHPMGFLFVPAVIAVGMVRGPLRPVAPVARSAGIRVLTIGVLLAPWFIWKWWLIRIPSDLLQQNNSGSGLLGQVGVRARNAAALYDTGLFDAFAATDLAQSWRMLTTTAWGAAGSLVILVPFCFLPGPSAEDQTTRRLLVLFAGLGALAVTGVFGIPQPLAVHGFIAVIPVAVIAAVGSATAFWSERTVAFLLLASAVPAWVLMARWTVPMIG
jgi:hypothetical protein